MIRFVISFRVRKTDKRCKRPSNVHSDGVCTRLVFNTTQNSVRGLLIVCKLQLYVLGVVTELNLKFSDSYNARGHLITTYKYILFVSQALRCIQTKVVQFECVSM
jgi:hypothetical protein